MTRGLVAANEEAISETVLAPVLFAELDFPSGMVRMFSGIGTIEWGGHTWTGAGNLGVIGGLEENSELARKTVTYTLTGVPNSIISVALNDSYQGRAARAYIGFIGRVPDASTTAYIDAAVSAGGAQPSEKRKKQIDNLVTKLKAYGTWAKMDGFHLEWADDQYFGRVNLINPGTYDLTAVNSPSFVANQGYASDGSTSYLDTNFNPATAVSPKFVQNDNHMGVWSITDAAASATAMGNTTHSIIPRTATSLLGTRNSNGTINTTGSVSSSIGHFLTNRSGASTYDRYVNGSQFDTITSTSQALTSRTLFVGGRNHTASEFTTRRLAASHFGGALTASDVRVIYNALIEYMTGEPHEMRLGLVADPELIDFGMLDFAKTTTGETGSITFSSESRFAAWERPQVRRYTDAEQQRLYPDDRGFEFVGQAAQKEIIWGRKE